MLENPSVDIIIPARNEQKYLGKCLQSLLQQNYDPTLLKIYVICNGSTDDTTTIAQQFGAQIIEAAPGTSVGALRNLALKASSGQLVAFIDAHCVVGNDWLLNLIKAFDTPAVGGCAGTIEYVCNETETAKFVNASIFQSDETLYRRTISGREAPYPWIPTGNAIFRREALRHIGYFNESLLSCEDTDLSWRVVLSGYRLEYVPSAPVLHYEQTNWQGLLRKHYRYGRGAAQLSQRYEFSQHSKLFSKIGEHSAPSEKLLQLAHAAGYIVQILANQKLPAIKDVHALPQLRPQFSWTANLHLQFSEHVIYWFDSLESVIIVLPQSRRRLTGSQVESTIIKSLERQYSREKTFNLLCLAYDITESQAAEDLDAFINELSERGVLKTITMG